MKNLIYVICAFALSACAGITPADLANAMRNDPHAVCVFDTVGTPYGTNSIGLLHAGNVPGGLPAKIALAGNGCSIEQNQGAPATNFNVSIAPNQLPTVTVVK